MLVVKVIQDLDVFGQRVTRMEVKPDYEANEQTFFRTLGFIWNKYTRNYSKIVTNKKEIQGVIGHLLGTHKDYTLEHIKIIKRKRSGNLKKTLSKLAKNTQTF